MLSHARSTTQCRVQFRELPENCRPAVVTRHRGIALVAIDSRTTCLEIMQWSADNLTQPELDIMRAAHGEPPVGQPVDDKWMLAQPVPQYIPESLALRSEPMRVPVQQRGAG